MSHISAAPVQLLPTKTGATPSRSPARSPAKRSAGITATQKQALVDNLQLEITERARKLRAQYALQAQGLRMRLEMRVNRIPVALRKMTIGELLEKHSEGMNVQKVKTISPTKIASRLPPPRTSPVKTVPISSTLQPAPRGTKRTSTAMEMSDELDKENNGANTSIINPKKRARTVAPDPPNLVSIQASTIPPTMSAAIQVLSPRSANQRTIQPPSPTKFPVSPLKPQGARPMSPQKPSVTLSTTAASRAKANEKTAAPKSKAAPSSRPTSRQAAPVRPKRGMVVADVNDLGNLRHSIDSDAASSTAGTTIVTNVNGRGALAPTASVAAKGKEKKVVARVASVTAKEKKAGASIKVPKEVVKADEVTVKGGRTLRKRG